MVLPGHRNAKPLPDRFMRSKSLEAPSKLSDAECAEVIR